MSDKTPIKNRNGQTILVRHEKSGNPLDLLAIIQHGYSGSMDQDHIRTFADVFLENGYDVLLMDCTCSFNDAGGNVEDCTIQTHYDDLEDVINWASDQNWYHEPFALLGHSLGGLSVLTYAQNHADNVSLLVPAAAVVSGSLLEDAFEQNMPESYQAMKDQGYCTVECSYKPGLTARRSYKWLETMQDWDALQKASLLQMPVLMLVGSEDLPTPPEHQSLLYNLLPGEKNMHIIDGADHVYAPKLDEAATLLNQWLKDQV